MHIAKNTHSAICLSVSNRELKRLEETVHRSQERRSPTAYINISFDIGDWSGSEGSNGRRKSTPAVYGVTADIGVNFSGVVSDSEVSRTAMRTSNASVN